MSSQLGRRANPFFARKQAKQGHLYRAKESDIKDMFGVDLCQMLARRLPGKCECDCTSERLRYDGSIY